MQFKRQSWFPGFVMLIAFSLFCDALLAQPEFNFKNAVLESGTDLRPGAVYRFAGVKAGVDARLTIRNLSGGAQLVSIDEPSSTGYNEALQPTIVAPATSTAYAEFQVELVSTAGSAGITLAEFPVTAIDLDAPAVSGAPAYNYVEFQVSNSVYEYDYVTPHLSLVSSSPQGEWLLAKNKSGMSAASVDTSVRSMMTTMLYKQSSGFVFRIGVQNTAPSSVAITRSIYFKRFVYPRINILPNRTLLSFSGAARAGNVVELNGILSASHTYNKILIEKNTAGEQFSPIGELSVTDGGSGQYAFRFTDQYATAPVNFYRARLLNTNDRVMETGTILAIKKTGIQETLRLVNTLISVSGGEVIVTSARKEYAVIRLVSSSGVLLTQQPVTLYNGSNNIRLALDPSLAGRQAFLRITTASDAVVQQVWLQ